MTRTPAVPPQIALLTERQLRDLADELFSWGALPVARDELRYVFTQRHGTPPEPDTPPPAPLTAWPSWWLFK